MSVVCGVQCWEGYFGNVIGCRLSKKKSQLDIFRKNGLFPVHARWCPRGSRKGA